MSIFFRFFKHVLGCKHLLSATPDGIAIQAYCALIACMPINVWTVDDVAEMHKLIALGVDGIITNRPDVLRGVISQGRVVAQMG